MIEEVEKKLAFQKTRLARLEASREKCVKKIRDYEATLRVLSELNGVPVSVDKEKKKTAAKIILEALAGFNKPASRSELVACIELVQGENLNDNTITGTLQRLRANGDIDCKDNLWSLKKVQEDDVSEEEEEDVLA